MESESALSSIRNLLTSAQKGGYSFSEHLPEMYQYSVQFFIERLLDQICKNSNTTPEGLTMLDVIRFVESQDEYSFLSSIIENEKQK